MIPRSSELPTGSDRIPSSSSLYEVPLHKREIHVVLGPSATGMNGLGLSVSNPSLSLLNITLTVEISTHTVGGTWTDS